MGMGGNIGTQSSTIVVRGLATGRLNIGDIWSVVGKELTIGFILGLVYGLLIGSVAQLQYSTLMLALAVCLAVVCSMSVAALDLGLYEEARRGLLEAHKAARPVQLRSISRLEGGADHYPTGRLSRS